MENFDQLSLNPSLQQAVRELGFSKPTPIQAQALPILLGADTDFIGLAATGTGKTATFSLPMLERIDPEQKGVQALILCPTRELSLQVSGQVQLLGKHLGVHAVPIYGGAGYAEQIHGLRKAAVVVGTPGRIIDHLERGTLQLDTVRTVILDEADEMISMGFREAIESILSQVPRENSRFWLFSATMSPAVRKVADEFLSAPQMVQVNRTEMLSSTVEQYYYMTQEKNKPEVLCKLIDAAEDFYGVIFCQTKALVVDLTRYLSERGYKADCLHGDMSQAARETAMKAFREKRVKILTCTDVAARGLDVKDVSHVINYSLPRELDNYVHRIGRTARSGKNGVAMSLVTASHRHLISKIEKMTKSKMNEGVIPTRKAIGAKKISQLLSQFTDEAEYQKALDLMEGAWKEAVATMSSEEVAARFLTLMFPWVFIEKKNPLMEKLHTAVTPNTAKPPTEQKERKKFFDRNKKYRDDEPPRRRSDRDFAGRDSERSRDDQRPHREGGEEKRRNFRSNFRREDSRPGRSDQRSFSKPGGASPQRGRRFASDDRKEFWNADEAEAGFGPPSSRPRKDKFKKSWKDKF